MNFNFIILPHRISNLPKDTHLRGGRTAIILQFILFCMYLIFYLYSVPIVLIMNFYLGQAFVSLFFVTLLPSILHRGEKSDDDNKKENI